MVVIGGDVMAVVVVRPMIIVIVMGMDVVAWGVMTVGFVTMGVVVGHDVGGGVML